MSHTSDLSKLLSGLRAERARARERQNDAALADLMATPVVGAAPPARTVIGADAAADADTALNIVSALAKAGASIASATGAGKKDGKTASKVLDGAATALSPTAKTAAAAGAKPQPLPPTKTTPFYRSPWFIGGAVAVGLGAILIVTRRK